MADDKKKSRDLLDQFNMMEDQRRPVDIDCQKISKYIVPFRGYWPTQGVNATQGEHRGDQRIDPAATYALRVMAAGQKSGMASSSAPWVRIELEDETRMNAPGAKSWLTETERRLYSALARSPFYQAIYNFYIELDAFGTAAVYQDMDNFNNLFFSTLTFGEYCIAVNEFNRVDTLFRRVPRPARAVVMQFGKDKVSPALKRMAEVTPYETVQLLHICRPRKDRDITKIDNTQFPFESTYMELDYQNKILQEKGYRDFPFHVGRYDDAGDELYGRGPGHDALPDVLQLQDETISKTKIIHRISEEPVQGTAETVLNADTGPGGKSITDGTAKLEPVFSRLPDPGPILLDLQELKQSIRSAFHNEVFVLDTAMDRKVYTATQILEMKAEKLQQLGPVTERNQWEFYDPLTARSLGLMWDSGQLPQLPESLVGQPYKMTYISTLARAQRAAGKSSLRDVAAFFGELSSVSQNTLDLINMDRLGSEYIRISDVPADLENDAGTVEQIRTIRAQEAAKAQALAQAAEGADVAKNLSETNTQGSNALTGIIDQFAGGAR